MKVASALRMVAIVLAGLAITGNAIAQAWPTKPIRLISPFSTGSTVDLQARLIAIPLAEILGQPVVVEDKAGAGGAIGLDFVAKSPPDGYTIGIGTTGPMTINPYKIGSTVPYDPN